MKSLLGSYVGNAGLPPSPKRRNFTVEALGHHDAP
jgi:hypothetical protein